jgi:hypothetical protein
VSTADQILSAKIAAVCRRHCSRGRIEDQDQAEAELRQLAGTRPDLLAQHAGICLGWAELTAPAETTGLQAEADLCKAAGAPAALIEQWIETGRHRRRSARATPHTGRNRDDSAGPSKP